MGSASGFMGALAIYEPDKHDSVLLEEAYKIINQMTAWYEKAGTWMK